MRVFLLEIKLMLKGIIRNTIALVLAGIVLVATSGFNVFKHSCHTEKTTQFSLIIPKFECEHDNHEHDADLPSCCQSSKTSKEEESCEASKCCDTDTYLVKLSITLDNQDLVKKIVHEFESLPKGNDIDITSPTEEISQIIVSNDLPPPLSGKSLHIFLHQLNIPYPSV